MASIYIIENKESKKRYVGKTTLSNPYERWKQHQYNVKSNYNPMVISDAMFKYGIDNFTFYVIETCDDDDVNEREIYWIEKFNTYKDGYNSTFGGDGAKRDIYHLTNSNIKPISCYTLDGEHIRDYDSRGIASKELGIKKTSITSCIKGVTFQAGGYRWSWKDGELADTIKRENRRGKIYGVSVNRERREFNSQADACEFIEGDRKVNSNVSKSIKSPSYNKLMCKGWYLFRDESETFNFTPAERPKFTSESARIAGRMGNNRQ